MSRTIRSCTEYTCMETAVVLLKISEIERKLENLVQVLNNLKKERADTNDTEKSEEVHWFVKISRKVFCYA